jgi:hypothetical protein
MFSVSRTSLVRYDLNLTLGCHRFYYLAPLPVLDPIYLIIFVNERQGKLKGHTQKTLDTMIYLIWFIVFNAIFQLYHGDQFYWWKKAEYPERTTDHLFFPFTLIFVLSSIIDNTFIDLTTWETWRYLIRSRNCLSFACNWLYIMRVLIGLKSWDYLSMNGI